MKKSRIFIVLLTLCMSCNEYILDRYNEQELTNIMLDAHTLGLIYNRQLVKEDSLKEAYYDVLAEKYQLSQSEFQQLLSELLQNADLYEKIFEDMNKKLEKLEQRGLDYN